MPDDAPIPDEVADETRGRFHSEPPLAPPDLFRLDQGGPLPAPQRRRALPLPPIRGDLF
jgi:hypothetical protein